MALKPRTRLDELFQFAVTGFDDVATLFDLVP